MKKGTFGRATLLGTILLGLLAALLPVNAQAVTYGSTVADPTVSAPWMVSIWNSATTNDEKDAEFICSGTLIAPHTVLTAAHCTLELGTYFVKVKSQALKDETPLTTVSGVWRSPRYDPKNFTNDIGLLKLDEDFPGITYPSLANAQVAKSINTKSIFTLYGWGRDQSGNLADLLRSARLSLQDVAAAKFFKKVFNPKTMISAGRKIVAENVWSGACPGDSGGPLIVSINQINVIAGVTSFGEKSCLTPNPTVFSRVSYYYSDIQSGLRSVELMSSVVNRTAPVAIVDPQITGSLVSNGTVKCDVGQWKNSVSAAINWTSPKRLIGVVTPTVRVLTSDAGQLFSCSVIVSTKSGTIVRRNLQKQAGTAPVLIAQPAISGADLSAPAIVGSTLRCDNWNWDAPVDAEIVQWFLTAQANPVAPVNGQLIGTGKTFSLDSNIVSQLKGRYVTCDVTGSRNGFSVDAITSIKLNPLDGPTLTSVNVAGTSLSSGSSLSCLYSASQNATQVDIYWGTSTDGFNFIPFPGVTGNVLQISKNVIQQGAGKVVACQVKVTNSAGQAQKVGIGSGAFPTPPLAPVVSISNPGTISAYSYLSCSAQAGVGYSGQLVYQWGITAIPNSTNFVGSTLSNSYNLSMNSAYLTQAAGNYLTCVATSTNEAGSTSAASSVFVPPTVLPLPNLPRPVLLGESLQATSLTDSLSIPNVIGFDSTKMSLVLSLNPAGGSCSSLSQISSTPSTVICSGLQPSTNYTAQLSVSYLSGGNGATQVSPSLSFTTGALPPSLYVCSTTCTGTLTSAQLTAEIADQRLIEAKSLTTVTVNGSQTGAPITHSTCVGLACSPGTAPVLPVSCGSAGVETTEVIMNTSAQITTAFRYCKPNAVDTTAPIVVNNSLATTGYAAIIPTSGAPASSIQVRFGASDSVGISSTSVRLVNAGNIVVATTPGIFLVGSVTAGTYQAFIATTATGPANGDTYQIQAQASDAAGNTSGWFTVGTFLVRLPSLIPSFGTISSVVGGFTVQISNYDSNFNWTSSATDGGNSTISSTGLLTVSSLADSTSSTVTVNSSRNGYASASSSILGTASAALLDLTVKPISGGISAIPSAVGSTIKVRFQALDGLGISNAWVQVKNSAGTVIGTYDAKLISGSSKDGIYESTISTIIPDFSSGGSFVVEGKVGGSGRIMWSWTQIGSFSLISPPSKDTQAPVIDISNTLVSPTSLYENGSISLSVPISDNVGVTLVNVRIGQLSFNLSRASGTTSSGTWTGSSSMNFAQGASDGYLPPGVYSPQITATDAAGNSSSEVKAAAFILGAQGGGATIASANAASTSGTLYPGGVVQITANVIAYNQIISAVRYSSDGYNLYKSGVLTEVSGNSYNKSFAATFTLAENQTPGNYTINLVAETANGRSSTTFPVSVTVVAAPVDSQKPSIVAGSASLSSPSITGQVVSVPSIGNISDGMSTNSDYTVSINVSDNVGVSSVTFYVDTSGDPARLGTQIPSTIGYATLVSGNAQSGSWSATSHFPSIASLASFGTSCGRYTVRVLAYDSAGNASGPIAAREIDIVSCSR